MSTLIWKELRENFRWALLAMLVIGGSEIFALYQTEYPGQIETYFHDGITLCKKPFLTVTMFGCAAAGIVLGLLQVLPELKRDRWAALLHRPVSRGRFFWGKAIAGVLLYLFATGVPLLVCIWLVATPGNFTTPFVPEMIRPGLADLVVGLAYYFAALLVALQSGGIMLRVLPLFAALYVSFFAVDEELFRVAVEGAVAMALALCVAGWGAIHGRESLSSRPWLGRIAFLIVIFYGACGVGDLAKSLGGMAGRTGVQKFSRWDILDNGEPVRIDYVNSVVVSATDVNGKPFADPKYKTDRIRNRTLGMNTATSYIGDSHGPPPVRYQSSYRESHSYLYALSPYYYPRFEQWFQLVKERRFIGFLPRQKKAFATLGSEGFGPAESTAPGFPADVETNRVGGDVLSLQSPDSLHFVSLGKREINAIALPAPAPIYGTSTAWASMEDGSVEFLGVALGTGMAVYDVQGRLAAMLPYHRDMDRWGTLSMGVGARMDRFTLQYEPSRWIDRKTRRSMPTYVETMDSQGNVLASFTLNPLPPDVVAPLRSSLIGGWLQSPAFFYGEMLYRKVGAALGSTRLRDALNSQLSRDPRSLYVITALVALALSGITFAWARRAQLPVPRVWGWSGFVLVLGLPGFIVFWLASERPRTVPCPACQRPRRIDAVQCGHCGAAWPEAETTGLEIFDRAPDAGVPTSA